MWSQRAQPSHTHIHSVTWKPREGAARVRRRGGVRCPVFPVRAALLPGWLPFLKEGELEWELHPMRPSSLVSRT